MKIWTNKLVVIAAMVLTGLAVSGFAQTAPAKKAPAKPAVDKSAELTPRLWVFMGLPGDAQRDAKYSETVELLRSTFSKRFGTKASDMHILFGKGKLKAGADAKTAKPADYKYRPCNLANLNQACADIVKLSADGRPNYVFILGHATPTKNDAFFNIAGPDISARKLANALKKTRRETPMAIFISLPVAKRFGRRLYLKNSRTLPDAKRVIINACDDDEKKDINEPEFGHVIARVFASAETDADNDGYITMGEVYKAAEIQVEDFFKTEGFVQTEWPSLDGDGNGRATKRPAPTDLNGANRVKLKIIK